MLQSRQRMLQLVWVFTSVFTCHAFSPHVAKKHTATQLTRRRAFTNKRARGEDTKIDESSDFPMFEPLLWKQAQQGNSKHMMDNRNLSILEDKNSIDPEKLIGPIVALLIAAGVSTAAHMGVTLQDVVSSVQTFLENPQSTLQNVVDAVEAMGPAGPLYFGLFYMLAEVLAVPATPLTMSAGYLFGLTQGVGVVLTAATAAACIAFFIGKTFLRSWVEGILVENPDFRKLDKAIGEQGFKLLLLVRLSPLFPFALSNYLYGASSVNFSSYFWGTLLGFAPGTIAYVYTGMVGKELLSGDGQPWYAYAAGFGLLLGFMKLATDVASEIIASIDDEEEITSP